MDYKTKLFYYYLDECYFHPERGKEYSSESEKKLAREAMVALWNKDSIQVNGITYSQEDIRTKVIDKMMPEILDRGIKIYREAKNVKYESAYLAGCIFRTLIDYDAYVERLFRRNFRS